MWKLLAIVSLLLTLTSPLEAKKKRKPPQGTEPAPTGQTGQQQAPDKPAEPPAAPQAPAEIAQVERKLVQYRTGEARSALAPVAGMAGQNAPVTTALGRVLDQEKKYGEAIAQLRRASELAPNDPAPWVYLGETYLHDKKTGDADAAFRRAADLARSASGKEAPYLLGIAQQRLKQYDAALQSFDRARTADPGNPLISYQIGVTRLFQGQWAEAAKQLSEALGQDSGIAYAYYYRGLAHEKMSRKDLLVDDLERFLALAPSAPDADRARSILQAAKR